MTGTCSWAPIRAGLLSRLAPLNPSWTRPAWPSTTVRSTGCRRPRARPAATLVIKWTPGLLPRSDWAPCPSRSGQPCPTATLFRFQGCCFRRRKCGSLSQPDRRNNPHGQAGWARLRAAMHAGTLLDHRGGEGDTVGETISPGRAAQGPVAAPEQEARVANSASPAPGCPFPVPGNRPPWGRSLLTGLSEPALKIPVSNTYPLLSRRNRLPGLHPINSPKPGSTDTKCWFSTNSCRRSPSPERVPLKPSRPLLTPSGPLLTPLRRPSAHFAPAVNAHFFAVNAVPEAVPGPRPGISCPGTASSPGWGFGPQSNRSRLHG